MPARTVGARERSWHRAAVVGLACVQSAWLTPPREWRRQLLQRTYRFDCYATGDCDSIGSIYEGHDWTPPGWTTNNGGSNMVWTDSTTGAHSSGAAGAEE